MSCDDDTLFMDSVQRLEMSINDMNERGFKDLDGVRQERDWWRSRLETVRCTCDLIQALIYKSKM